MDGEHVLVNVEEFDGLLGVIGRLRGEVAELEDCVEMLEIFRGGLRDIVAGDGEVGRRGGILVLSADEGGSGSSGSGESESGFSGSENGVSGSENGFTASDSDKSDNGKSGSEYVGSENENDNKASESEEEYDPLRGVPVIDAHPIDFDNDPLWNGAYVNNLLNQVQNGLVIADDEGFADDELVEAISEIESEQE